MIAGSRMLLLSCAVAVIASVALSTFVLLKSRFEPSCSGNYRPRAETSCVLREAVMPDEESSGLDRLAGALCCMAAGAHSKSAAEQEQIAATFWNLCCTEFGGVRVDPAVTAFVEGLNLSASKAKKK
jgi:hypothetical protein